jgi:uncharacterized protein (DUF433 family)
MNASTTSCPRAARDTPETILKGYPFLGPDDIRTCPVYANRLVSHERAERCCKL